LEIKRGTYLTVEFTYLTAVLKDEVLISRRERNRNSRRALRFSKTLRDPFNTANNLRKVHAENAEFIAESAK
jgi:hypothetical protein